MARSRDLFDDTTMTFGEHLEVLRVHVFRALIGVIAALVVTLIFGNHIFSVLRSPIEQALYERGIEGVEADIPEESLWDYAKRWFSGEEKPVDPNAKPVEEISANDDLKPDQLRVRLQAEDAIAALRRAGIDVSVTPRNAADPAASDVGNNDDSGGDVEGAADPTSTTNSTVPSDAGVTAPPRSIEVIISAPEFAQLRRTVKDLNRVTTLKVEEGFLVYIKVCFIAAFILASPWVFFQVWQFVAAGLYPHERKYVYVYMPMSLGLFVAGGLSGYYFAFPLMLKFLIGFNDWMGITLQPRLSEYISLVLMLPLMFGISFQLPMVMLFLERINLFSIDGYKKNRRMAILVIAVASMMLTPSDPGSMLLMMFPLVFLYEVGIHLCRFQLKTPARPIT